MNDTPTVIMGSAAFLVVAGTVALKIVLGLYLDERKEREANFIATVNAQIISIRSAYEGSAHQIAAFDLDVKAVKEELPRIRSEMKEVRGISQALLTFFSSGGDRESEIVPVGENAWLVRKKNGKPPGSV